MGFYALCRPSDGVVEGFGSCPDAETPLQGGHRGLQSVAISPALYEEIRLAPLDYRLQGDAIARKPAMAATIDRTSIKADGVETATISGLPDPCKVTVSGAVALAPTTVTGGSLDLSSTVRGSLTVRIERDPEFRAWTATINAT